MHIFVLARTTGLSDEISITIDLTVCNDAHQPLCGSYSCHLTQEGGRQPTRRCTHTRTSVGQDKHFERAPRPPEACVD